MIWSSIAEKGGSGKTTFITNLAVALAREESRVLMLDFDPMGALTRWGGFRADQDTEGSIQVLSAIGHAPVEVLEQLEMKDVDEVLLDVPGSDNESLRQALMVSDVAVMPCVPGGFDFTSYEHTLSVIEEAIDLKLDTAQPLHGLLFLNRVRPNSTVARRTRQHMREHIERVRLLERELGQLDDFALAAQMGLGVYEYDRKGSASKHTRALMRELITHVQERST